MSEFLTQLPQDPESLGAPSSCIRPLPRVSDVLRNRFLLLQELGSGTSGIVFLAKDELTQRKLAVKVLRQTQSLPRFKNEHRLLRELAHPYLVTSLRLFAEEFPAFLTMPYVHGRHLDQMLLPWDGDEVRLRACFRKLAEAIHALHQLGIVHCDIKPSNVLVSGNEHVRLIDFGLAHKIFAECAEPCGTPGYVAPECIVSSQNATDRSDWYSFGTILYQILSGRLPFEGSLEQILRDKREKTAPPLPPAIMAQYPDLAQLALELLKPLPEQRPDIGEIAHVLEFSVSRSLHPATDHRAASDHRAKEIFCGREAELARLHASYQRIRCGRPEIVELIGPSGIGKTSLALEFTKQIAHSTEAPLIVRGTCYEHEIISHNALSDVVSQLVKYDTENDYLLGTLAPTERHALLQIFPELEEYIDPNLEEEPRAKRPTLEPASRVFGRFLARLSQKTPLVLILDQLKWADTDSARFLTESFLELGQAPLLILFICRDDEREASQFLRYLESRHLDAARETLTLPPLDKRSIRKLVQTLEGLDGRMLEQAAGNPMVLKLLARGDAALSALDHDARLLGAWIALAGHPIEFETLEAALPQLRELEPLVRLLEKHRFIRAVLHRGLRMLTTSHDWTHDRLLESMPLQDRRHAHRRIAEVLTAASSTAVEEIAEHFYLAQAWQQAIPWMQKAAKRAFHTQAFSNEAMWWERLLNVPSEHGLEHELDRNHITVAAARAWGDAGRGQLAATHYLTLAEHSTHEAALSFRLQAAEQFFRSGDRASGFTELHGLLKQVGLSVPRSKASALLSLLLVRLRLRFRLRRFAPQAGESPPRKDLRSDPRQLLRLQATFTAKSGFFSSDFILGAYYGGRCLELALDAGEPNYLLRALCDEVLFTANEGTRAQDKVKWFLECIDRTARAASDGSSPAYVALSHGTALLLLGHFGASLAPLMRAEKNFLASCPQLTWELSFCRMLLCSARQFQGDLAKRGAELEGWIAEAERRSDLASLRFFLPKRVWSLLAKGEAEKAEVAYEYCLNLIGNTPRPKMDHARVNLLFQRAFLDFYKGESAECQASLQSELQRFYRSPVSRSQGLRVTALCIDAGSELLCAAKEALEAGAPFTQAPLTLKSRSRNRRIERLIHRLEAEQAGYASAYARLLTATRQHQLGRNDVAQRLLQEALTEFESEGLDLVAASVMLRLGQTMSGKEAARTLSDALARFEDFSVVSPWRFADIYTPGFLFAPQIPDPDEQPLVS